MIFLEIMAASIGSRTFLLSGVTMYFLFPRRYSHWLANFPRLFDENYSEGSFKFPLLFLSPSHYRFYALVKNRQSFESVSADDDDRQEQKIE